MKNFVADFIRETKIQKEKKTFLFFLCEISQRSSYELRFIKSNLDTTKFLISSYDSIYRSKL